MKRLNPKAILIGCLVDWLGTLAFDLFFVITTGMMAMLRGLSLEETGVALQSGTLRFPAWVSLLVCTRVYSPGRFRRCKNSECR